MRCYQRERYTIFLSRCVSAEVFKWLYYDSADAQPFTAGRYRHGRPVRTFRYYAPTGQLDHSERYRREGFCEVHVLAPGREGGATRPRSMGDERR